MRVSRSCGNLERSAFASGSEILRRLLQWRQNASVFAQGCTHLSSGPAIRPYKLTRRSGRTSSPLRPCLGFRYTQAGAGIINLRPGGGATYHVRENGLMISRFKHLERYGLANEVEPGRWGVSDRAEGSSTELSERNDVIETEIRRALPRWANVWV